MGVDFRLIFYARDAGLANRAAAAAFDRIQAIDAIMSDYRDDSELMRLAREAHQDEPVAVSSDLHFVLSHAASIGEKTDGAFDVTVGHLVRLWRRARRQHRLPREDALSTALAKTNYEFIDVDPDTPRVTLHRDDLRLDLGGIAKGYAADAALKVLRAHGIHRALVDASGDIAVGRPPPDRDHWSVGIAQLDNTEGTPSRHLAIANRAVATSGDYWQFVEIDGRRYSHIVDPRNGLGIPGPSRVTVIANDGTTADAWASAISVLGPDDGIRVAESIAELEAFVEFEQDGERITRETTGFAPYVSPESERLTGSAR